jgi:DNA-3-methyladenine glycosylase II
LTATAKHPRALSPTRTVLELRPRSPFRLDLTVWALRRRPQNAIDTWDGYCYRRTLLLDGRPLELAVVQRGSANAPRLEAAVSGHRLTSAAEDAAGAALSRLLGLDRDLSAFYTQAARDEKLRPLAQRYRGLKPPCFPNVFECLLNAVACQQLSLEAGLTLLNRLAATARPDDPAPPPFPAPADVTALTPHELSAAGFSAQKAETILALAAATAGGGRLDLEALEHADNESAGERLLELRGIGPWSADYVLLRGLGRLSVFPRSDIGALNGLRRLLATESGEEAVRALTRWEPYAGLVYFHLLLYGLEARVYSTRSKAERIRR